MLPTIRHEHTEDRLEVLLSTVERKDVCCPLRLVNGCLAETQSQVSAKPVQNTENYIQ